MVLMICSSKLSQERASLLVMFALMLVALVGMIGLVIDGYRMSLAREELKRAADAASLAALQAYTETSQRRVVGGAPFATAVQAANRAAERVLAANLHVDDVTGFDRPDAEGLPQIGLDFGNYRTTCPIEEPECTCTNSAPPPCFEELNAPDVIRADAVQVRAGTQESYFLANILGFDRSDFVSRSLSYIVPNSTMLALDLSLSAISDSYNEKGFRSTVEEHWGLAPHEPDGCTAENGGCIIEGSKSLFTFPISEQKLLEMGSGSILCDRRNALSPTVCGADGSGCIMSEDLPAYYQSTWGNTWNEMRLRREDIHVDLQSAPFMHAKNEYWCRELNFPDPVTGGLISYYFLVDYGTDNPVTVNLRRTQAKPQPLFTFLSTLNFLLEDIRDRDSGASNVGFLAFDHQIFEPRAGGFLNRTMALGSTSQPDYQHFVDATNVDPTSATNSDKFVDQLLFPRPSWTNINDAIIFAHNEFIPNGEPLPGVKGIILISDGMSNCSQRAVDEGLVTLEPDWDQTVPCAHLHDFIYYSLEDVLNTTTEYLVPAEIALHVILEGAEVGPHTLAMKSTMVEGSCMKDGEARVLSEPFVQYGDGQNITLGQLAQDFGNRSLESPFYYPNIPLYHASTLTNGLWGPIRRNCVTAGGSCLDVQPLLNDVCGGLNDGEPPARARDVFVQGQRVTDGVGRLIVDPMGRSIQEQIETIFGNSLESEIAIVD